MSFLNVSLSRLDGTNGFVVGPMEDAGEAGPAVAGIGDVNADGIDDIVVGVSGQYSVVFGRSEGFPSRLDPTTLDGSNGFRLDGVDPVGRSGTWVAGIADVNGDGLDDFMVGVPSSVYASDTSGTGYVVFGNRNGFPEVLNLDALDGRNGFRLEGFDASEVATAMAGVGDVNGDGLNDFAVLGGVRNRSTAEGWVTVSTNYVVFGRDNGFAASLNLAALDSRDALRIDGWVHSAAPAGDVNGDGVDDIILGAPYARPDGLIRAGTSYVILGRRGDFAESIDLASIDSEEGFRFNGAVAGELSGASVAGAGDVNGDGTDDIIIGAPAHIGSPYFFATSTASASYVVFGRDDGSDLTTSLDRLDGQNGYRISFGDGDDLAPFEVRMFGHVVAGAGDLNGDGFDDIVIGAPRADVGNRSSVSYVVFGGDVGFDAEHTIASLDIVGLRGEFRPWFYGFGIGVSVGAAGDVNADGVADLIISAPDAGNGVRGEFARAYVIFGSAEVTVELDDIAIPELDGTTTATLTRLGDVTQTLTIALEVDDPAALSLPAAVTIPAGQASTTFTIVANDDAHVEPTQTVTITAGGVERAELRIIDDEPRFRDINLKTLDGSNGFRLEGIAAGDTSGHAVAGVGDINGDGIDDFAIGAPDLRNRADAGQSYVVFGGKGAFPRSLDLVALDGSNGFRLDGSDARDLVGYTVAGAGDVNGDGVDDLIVGAPGDDGDGPYARSASTGASYVVFGRTDGFAASLDLSALDGEEGFRLDGVEPRGGSGASVTGIGDFNGDNLDDIMVATYAAEGGGTDRGGVYVVFGSTGGFPAVFDLADLDGDNGFRLAGMDVNAYTRLALGSAGDVNGDGLSDIVIGAGSSNVWTPTWEGRLTNYVVFGRSSADLSATLDLSALNGKDGFRLDGDARGDQNGQSVGGGGDINGDGFDDIIIGAPGRDRGDVSNAGAAYIVWGRAEGFEASVSLARFNDWWFSGYYGFRVDGAEANTEAGKSVAVLGDVNGDGFDDFTTGGEVIFGQSSGFTNSRSLAALDGRNGYRLDDSLSTIAGAGDVNGDGIDDIIAGASRDGPDGREDAGTSYVVFGRPAPPLTLALEASRVAEGETLVAAITRRGDVDEAVTVSLSCLDPSSAVAPTSIELAPGQVSATFLVRALLDGVVDGTQTTTLVAGTGEASAEFRFEVTDVDFIGGPDAGPTLVGTRADELFVPGPHPLTTITDNGGGDDVDVSGILNDGQRQVIRWLDYTPEEDRLVGLSRFDVRDSFSRNGGTTLALKGDDGDLLIVTGAELRSDLTLADADVLVG